MQTKQIRAAIDQYRLFCDRYEILSVDNPKHATETSVVLRAIDNKAGDDDEAIVDVALKLMKHKTHFDNERSQRTGLSEFRTLSVPVSPRSSDYHG